MEFWSLIYWCLFVDVQKLINPKKPFDFLYWLLWEIAKVRELNLMYRQTEDVVYKLFLLPFKGIASLISAHSKDDTRRNICIEIWFSNQCPIAPSLSLSASASACGDNCRSQVNAQLRYWRLSERRANWSYFVHFTLGRL